MHCKLLTECQRRLSRAHRLLLSKRAQVQPMAPHQQVDLMVRKLTAHAPNAAAAAGAVIGVAKTVSRKAHRMLLKRTVTTTALASMRHPQFHRSKRAKCLRKCCQASSM